MDSLLRLLTYSDEDLLSFRLDPELVLAVVAETAGAFETFSDKVQSHSLDSRESFILQVAYFNAGEVTEALNSVVRLDAKLHSVLSLENMQLVGEDTYP